jgi:4-hydroxy-3-methylbut-2-enyl diphosphate reductase
LFSDYIVKDERKINSRPEISIIIDPKAGFCGGVKRAMNMVQKEFDSGREVFVRGELIHNQREMERLYRQGLKICHDLNSKPCQTLFIRTHGEAPQIYRKAHKSAIQVIDATCKNVRQSQKMIARQAKAGRNIYIFGKKDHPEVIGLLGYCRGRGVVFQSEDEIELITKNIPSLLIPQTTADPVKFEAVRKKMSALISDLAVYYAICPFVSQRERELKSFAKSVQALIFVGGKHSSNTKVLFEVCKRENPHSFFAESADDLHFEALSKFHSIGISGSASTPMWQLQEIAYTLKNKLVNNFKSIKNNS